MVSHWEFSSVFGVVCRRSNKACVDLAKADPALANAFCTATNFKSCRCPRFDFRDQISGLTFGASNRLVFSGRSYLASFLLSFVSDNDADCGTPDGTTVDPTGNSSLLPIYNCTYKTLVTWATVVSNMLVFVRKQSPETNVLKP